MTTTIMTRAAAPTTDAAARTRRLGELLARMAREADTRIPQERWARRTLQQMQPSYERQPVLTLHRPAMSDGPCPLCERYNCDPSNCPPSSAAPAPATVSTQVQCAVCGGRFGVTATPRPAVSWTCSACRNLGY